MELILVGLIVARAEDEPSVWVLVQDPLDDLALWVSYACVSYGVSKGRWEGGHHVYSDQLHFEVLLSNMGCRDDTLSIVRGSQITG